MLKTLHAIGISGMLFNAKLVCLHQGKVRIPRETAFQGNKTELSK